MTRALVPEIMDDPSLDASAHRRALRGLARLNWWSNSAGILWPGIVKAAARHANRPLRVLDVATGAGDVPHAVHKRAKREGIELELTACDISPRAVDHARAVHGDAIDWQVRDVIRDGIDGEYDVVCCSLFMHHLDEGEAITLLRAMRDAARRLVLVSDLERSRSGLLLTYVAAYALTRSRVVHVDGPRSVRAAFTRDQFADLAAAAGLSGANLRRCWPYRLLLEWSAA